MYTILACVASVLFGACESSIPRVPAQGELAGRYISTTVDSMAARYYLEHYLRGENADSEMHRQIDKFHAQLQKGQIDRDTIAHIANSMSPDLATLIFADYLSSLESNARMQANFSEELAEILRPQWSFFLDDAQSREYVILFAPGWLYLSDPTTGADFLKQREILDRMGIQTGLIETAESGSVEHNAEIIAAEIMLRGTEKEKLILVSASKSGAEVAFALGAYLTSAQTTHVHAWVNVGGVIQGTQLADTAMDWPQWWGLYLYFWWKEWDVSGLASMTTNIRRASYAYIHIPDNILVVNYMAVPLSGDISDGVKSRYELLRPYGPNDGLTLLVDQIIPGSVTVLELGLDHFFRDSVIEWKTVALFRTVVKSLASQQGAMH
tara:strand:- start:4494 stop:5636 length:1143 start_codon:yes stop_codon:yes gene_type:complete